MNYFAHARVAAEQSTGSAFVLGAMLPDFAHMIGSRIARLENDALQEGRLHHHRADDAFHRAPRFLEWVREGTTTLQDAGLGRGPARGAAHVGIELLFDGALVGDPRADAPYLNALEDAPDLGAGIRWTGEHGRARWKRLLGRLREDGLPGALRDPARVAARLARVLEPRERLRIAPHERAIVEDWLGACAPEVVRAAPDLLEQTIASPHLPSPGSNA